MPRREKRERGIEGEDRENKDINFLISVRRRMEVEESSTLTLFTGGLFKRRRCFFTSNLCLLTDAPEAHDSQTSTRRRFNSLWPSLGRAMPLTDEDPQGQRDHLCPVVPPQTSMPSLLLHIGVWSFYQHFDARKQPLRAKQE